MKKHFSTIFNRLVAKHINDPYNTTSISNGNSLRKEGEENSKLLESVIDYKQEDLTHLETKRDISVEVAAQEEYKDSTNSQTNFELLEIPEINKYVQEEADILGKKQDPSPTKNSTELTNTLVNEDREQTAPQTFPDKDFNSVQPTVSSPTTTESELGHLTPQSPKTLPSAAQTQLIVPGFFLSSFVGTIAAVLLLGLMGLLIYHVYKKRVNRMPKGYEKLGSTSKLEEGEGKKKYLSIYLSIYIYIYRFTIIFYIIIYIYTFIIIIIIIYYYNNSYYYYLAVVVADLS